MTVRRTPESNGVIPLNQNTHQNARNADLQEDVETLTTTKPSIHSDPMHNVRNKSTSTEPHMKHAYLILTAIDEVIKERKQEYNDSNNHSNNTRKQNVNQDSNYTQQLQNTDPSSSSPSPYPTPTLYFTAIMSALDTHPDDGDTLSSLLYLLSVVLPQLPTNIIRHQYESVGSTLLYVIQHNIDRNVNQHDDDEDDHSDDDNERGNQHQHKNGKAIQWQQSLYKSLLHCIGTLLSSLDINISNPLWIHRRTLSLYQTLLLYSLHSKSKVRKEAMKNLNSLFSVITGNGTLKLHKIWSTIFLSFYQHEIQQSTEKRYHTTLYLCTLLQSTIQYLTVETIAQILESLLTLCHTHHNILYIQVIKCCQIFFEHLLAAPHDHQMTHKHLDLVYQLLNVLLNFKPTTQQYDTTAIYCFTLITGFQTYSLYSSINQYLQLLTKYIILLSDNLLTLNSSKQSIIIKTTDTILQLMYAIPYSSMSHNYANHNNNNSNSSSSSSSSSSIVNLDDAQALMSSIEALLSYKYKTHWVDVFTICSTLIACFPYQQGKHDESIYKKLLTSIDALLNNEDVNNEFHDSLIQVIDTAMTMLQPSTLLHILPLNLPTSTTSLKQIHTTLQHARTYMLPLLRSAQCTSLKWWIDVIYQQHIVELSKLREHASEEDKQSDVKVLDTVIHQLWDSLPSFCIYATDINQFMKSFTKMVMTHLQAYDATHKENYITGTICKGIDNLVRYHEHKIRGKPIDGKSQIDELFDDVRSQHSRLTHRTGRMVASAAAHTHRNSKKKPTSSFSSIVGDGEDDDDDDDVDEDDMNDTASQASKASTALSRVSISPSQQSSFTAIRRQKPIKFKQLLQKKITFLVDDRISSTYAEQQLKAISEVTPKLIPLLLNIAVTLSNADKRTVVLNAISSLCSPSVTDSVTFNQTFLQILEKMNAMSKSIGDIVADGENAGSAASMDMLKQQKEQLSALIDIAMTLCRFELNESNLAALYEYAKHGLTSNDSAVQKRSYKTISLLIDTHSDTFFIPRWRDVTQSIQSASSSLTTSASKTRLLCVRSVLLGIPTILTSAPESWNVISAYIGEVLLGLKERASKSRESAYTVLTELGHALLNVADIPEAIELNAFNVENEDADMQPSESRSSRKDHPLMNEYILMLLGGLAGSTAHMQSAAVLSLARVIYEFYSQLSDSTLSNILVTVMALFNNKNRELIKSLLGFTKVCVLRMDRSTLEPHLENIITGLSLWSDDSKNKFKLKVRVILQILIRKFDEESVRQYVPAQHHPLIDHIVKMKKRDDAKKLEIRRQRKLHRDDAPKREKYNTDNKNGKAVEFETVLNEIDAESDGVGKEKRSNVTSNAKADNTSKTRKRGRDRDDNEAEHRQWLMDDTEASTLDFLDSDNVHQHIAIGNAESGGASGTPDKRKRELELGSGVSIGKSGRIIVSNEDQEDTVEGDKKSDALQGEHDTERATEVKADSGVHRGQWEGGRKRAKFAEGNKFGLSEGQWRSQSGAAYKSKRAGGDVQRKGMAAPHSFIPMDPNSLNRRKKFTAQRRFQSVISHAKQGASAGKRKHKH